MKPTSETQLAELVAGAEGPLAIGGGGTQGIICQGAELSTAGLSGVTLHEPGALTLVAGAGTPLHEIEAVLGAQNQRLAFEPMDHRGLLGTTGSPTIGGVVAGNVSGPRRIQAGACRDFLLGVRFVDGTGQVIRNGGRVMKNVTGYDLVKLMAGSWGTLGVLSEVALKVLPLPEATGVVLIEGLTVERAVAAMSAALGSPWDVTAAAHSLSGVDGEPVTMIRVEGFASPVKYRTAALQDLLKGYGESTAETDPERTRAAWVRVRDVEAFHDRSGNVWRLSVKPTDASGVLERIAPDAALLDWGGGRIWVLTPQATDVRAAMQVPGHATLVRGSGFPRFHPEPSATAAIASGLRARFDPRGILNAGLMG